MSVLLQRLRRTALMVVLSALALHAAGTLAACPPDCSNQTLNTPNFSHQDLSGANFTGATIIGGVFVRAKLVGAHFDNATFKAGPGTPILINDFSHADLSGATFTGATFAAPTYFTYATLGSAINSVLLCADFSNTVMNNGMAVFGDEPLTYGKPRNATDCRTKFRGVKMNCEFIDDWRNFDLTGADVSACLDKLACREVSGSPVCRDFSGAIMDRVHLDNAILDGASFKGASLMQATLSNASLQCAVATPPAANQCVDMSGALLHGAILNNANLSGASLHHALLSPNIPLNIEVAAKVRNAHLKNVNLSNADLSGVDFTSSNFYGDKPVSRQCATTDPDGGDHTGFTKRCASAYKATIAGTDFTDAYLFAVDFSSAVMTGANFRGAVLVAADFGSATLNPDAYGHPTSFVGAYLQGTNLDTTQQLQQVDVTQAYFDFTTGGNQMDITLVGANHNAFACSSPSTCTKAPPPGDVCVYIGYSATTVPAAEPTITCPDKGGGPCGDPSTPAGKPRWQSDLIVDQANNPGPRGWYWNDATYTAASNSAAMCNGKGDGTSVTGW